MVSNATRAVATSVAVTPITSREEAYATSPNRDTAP